MAPIMHHTAAITAPVTTQHIMAEAIITMTDGVIIDGSGTIGGITAIIERCWKLGDDLQRTVKLKLPSRSVPAALAFHVTV